MIILTLDTSGPVCSVAVMEQSVLRYEARAVNRLTHSESLMPMVQEALQKSGVPRETLTHLACVVGPGSFTGVRIGVAAAQGMARGMGLPCIAINALEAMAWGACMADTVICTIRDARSSQVYGAAFRDGKRLINDCALKLAEFLDAVSPLGERLYFLGDGAPVYHDQIVRILGQRALIAPPHLVQPGAGHAACLAMEKMREAVDPGQLMPLYLRAPQAERLRAMRDGHGL